MDRYAGLIYAAIYIAVIIGSSFINYIFGASIFALGIVYILYLFIKGLRTMWVERAPNAKIYIIRKGNHYCNRIMSIFPILIPSTRPLTISRTFTFNNSCIYKFNNEDDFDINKLFGITNGLCAPTKNSIRFGWNCEKSQNKVSIHAFEHLNGEMNYYFMTNVNLNVRYKFEIIKYKYMLVYNIYNEDGTLLYQNNHQHTFPKKKFGFLLNPYFGGNNVAPHEIIFYD